MLSYRPVGHQHDPNEWCLFVDSSKVSFQAVILHNGNKLPSVPLSHAANMKESYENIKLFLEKIQNEKYNWNICRDLKVIGLQFGYTKFCCFLCEWNSRDRKHHYIQKQWSKENCLFQDRKI